MDLSFFAYPPIRFTYPILRPSCVLNERYVNLNKISGFILRGVNCVFYFDAQDVHSIKVFKDERGVFWLYYNGPRNPLIKPYNGSQGGIGLAKSLDGMFFIKPSKNPILKPSLCNWDSGYLWKCSPLKLGNKFLLYYGAFSRDGKSGIGLAVSDDGVFWTKCKKPILYPERSKKEEHISTPAVMYDKEKNIFFMLYLIKPHDAIGLAYSANGIKWKKYKNNPVITRSSDWEDKGIAPFCLAKKNGTYLLLYEGKSSTKIRDWRIGVAYSRDVFHWVKYSKNPILGPGPSGNFDEFFVSDPSLVADGDILRLYYGCGDNHGLGYGGVALFPLKPICRDFFRVRGVPLNGKIIKDHTTDGVIFKGWLMITINIRSDSPGKFEVQTLCNKNWICHDMVSMHPNKVIRYKLPNMSDDCIFGVRLKFSSTQNIRVSAKWILEKPSILNLSNKIH